jgi:hypothetical protein
MEKNQFPPILLLRRYLKLAVEMCRDMNLMDVPLAAAPELPFSLSAIPQSFPQPSQLRLWVVEIAQQSLREGRSAEKPAPRPSS